MADTQSWLQNRSTIEDQSSFGKIMIGTHFPLSLAIVVGNSIALVVFLRKTFRVKKSNYLLVNLTLADLLVGTTSLVTSIITLNSSLSAFENENRFLVEMVNAFVFHASVYALCVISVERVLAVFWPFHHRLAQRWHYFTAIALVWSLSGIAVFSGHVFQQGNLNAEGNVMYFFFFYFLILISLLTIFISYLSIWIKMKFFTKFRNCRTIQENSKLTKTLFIVTVVSLATWLPKYTMDCVFMINNVNRKQYADLDTILSTLVLSNSFINLVVYSFRIPEFRREIRQVFCRCR